MKSNLSQYSRGTFPISESDISGFIHWRSSCSTFIPQTFQFPFSSWDESALLSLLIVQLSGREGAEVLEPLLQQVHNI